MKTTNLSERERLDYEALSPKDQEGYRNLRETELGHRQALDLLTKWKTEDAARCSKCGYPTGRHELNCPDAADAQLADELAAAEEALGYWNVGGINPDPDGSLAERVILAQNAICARLDLSLDETELGLTKKANEAIDAFVAEHRTTAREER